MSSSAYLKMSGKEQSANIHSCDSLKAGTSSRENDKSKNLLTFKLYKIYCRKIFSGDENEKNNYFSAADFRRSYKLWKEDKNFR